MAAERQIGIRMTVDATSVTTMVPQATREFEKLGLATESAAQRATRSVAQVNMSVRDLVTGAAGLTIVASAIQGITNAITSLPQRGFAFTSEVEVAQMGMSGILGSMTAINGQQTTWNQGLRISADMIGKLNDDALRTAATSQELVGVFQALLAPGLSARMTLEQIRELTVVGTNAVKSMGLANHQVVQELRDLVAGGISPASSTLATALGLKDSDIAAARASSEGLFAFLMKRLEGFKASSEAFSGTIKGSFDQLQEGATRVAAEAMTPLTQAIRVAIDETSKLFLTVDQAGNAQLNQGLISGLRDYAEAGASALTIGRDTVSMLWEHRDGITTLAAAYAAFKISQWGADAARALAAQMELAQAARLARVEAVAQQATDAQAVLTSREKVAAIMAELQAQQLAAQADAAAAASQIAHLQTTREAIALSRAEVLAKMESARTSMAQAEAQIQAARAAGAQSFALAMVREGTVSLTAAQARHAALMSELAVLGQQQARVNAAITASTVAQTAATNAASAAAGRLAAAQGAASVASRGFGLVVGALGGPVGIAIIAVSALAMWLYRLKSAADDAAKAGVQIQRAEAAAARGEKPEFRDIAAMQSELDKWKDKRDTLLASGKDSMTEWVNGAPVKSTVESLNAGIANLEGRLVKLNEAAQNGSTGNQQLTLTLEGTRQAWARANADVKTATAVQEDYDQKLQASQSSYKAYREQLEKNNASPKTLADAAARQAENEKALASERDKQLKALKGGAGAESAAARAEKRGLDAQIEAVRQGYKLLASQVADGVDAIDSERRQDLVGEYTAVQRKRDLQLQDLTNREAAVRRELELSRQKKDSEKEQQTLQGELREIEQQRANVQAKAGRDLQELLVAPQIAQRNALQQTTTGIYEQAQAQEVQNAAHGKAKTALHDLMIAQLERQRADLEATDNVIPGYIKALDDRIAAEKRLRVAVGESEGLEIAADWKKKQKDEAKKTSDDMRSLFRQGVMDAFEGGDGALASIGKSLRNTIVTSVADAFYDAMLKDAVNSFTSMLSGALKGALSGGSATSGASVGKAILGTLGSAFSGGLSTNAAVAAANSIGGSDIMGTFIGLKGLVPSAKGNVFSGAAGLQSYVNTLVDRPTIFPFAKGGLGLMGEAGTEGIFPLKRDGQGRLGVIAQGGAGGGDSLVYSPAYTINIDSRSDRGQIMADLQQALGQNNRAQFEQLKTMKVVPA